MTKAEIVEALEEIAVLLDLQGENDELTALVAVAATGELTVLQTAAALERFATAFSPFGKVGT